MKLLILLFIAAAAAHPGIMWMELLHAPFLAEVSWNAQFDYFKILYNQTLTIAKQKEEIKLWAKRNDVSKEVTSFFHKFNKRMEKTNKNVAKVIHALPIALRNLTKIMKNEKQTLPEMMAAIKHLKEEQPLVFRVLKSAIKEVMHEHGSHGTRPNSHEGRQVTHKHGSHRPHPNLHEERHTTHKQGTHETQPKSHEGRQVTHESNAHGPHPKPHEERQSMPKQGTHEAHLSSHEERQVTHKTYSHETHPKPQEELQVTPKQVTHETHPSTHEEGQVTSHKPLSHELHPKPEEELQVTHEQLTHETHPSPHEEPEVTSKPDSHESYTKPYEEHQTTHGPGGPPDFNPKPHGAHIPLGGPEPEKTQQGKPWQNPRNKGWNNGPSNGWPNNGPENKPFGAAPWNGEGWRFDPFGIFEHWFGFFGGML
nr:Protein of unknown function DUF148 domain containing protein [Haemonchus contortus]